MIDNSVIIIAEAGVNHNGDVVLAKKLIDVAKDCGVDYIKFQTFKAKNLVSKKAKVADYQKKNLGINKTQFEMLKSLEIDDLDFHEIIKYAKNVGIKIFSTAFDLEGLRYLEKFKFDFFKIPSGEITNYTYLKEVARIGKPVIMSTGMANIDEIKSALYVLTKKISLNDITILHCNSEYPTPMIDVNLRAMHEIKNTFNVKVGYSDHTKGIEVPIAAVAMGASVIEKHFTLSRKLEGPDHKASLEPGELKKMVNGIRNIELAISGDGIKKPSSSELKNILIVRKSVHTSTFIKKGTIIKEKNLISLRPGNGISPMKIKSIIGKKATKDLEKGKKLDYKDFI